MAIQSVQSGIHWYCNRTSILLYADFTRTAFAQNWILFGLGIPAYQALAETSTPLGPVDAILTALVLLDLLIEFTADNQQYSFQTFKHSKPRMVKPDAEEWPGARIKWTGEDARLGFVTRGLWAWSRHPNFAAEQTFWVSLCSLLEDLAYH